MEDEKGMAKRSEIFTGGEFLITPSATEIERGIIWAGHRTAVFCDDVFPSDTVFQDGEGRRLDWELVRFPLKEIFHYYAFLGAGELFPTLIAESEKNREIIRESRLGADTPVWISALKCRELFEKHGFEEGDALKMTILDYEKGIFEYRFLSASERKASAQKQWCADLTGALKRLIAERGDSLSITEQLTAALTADGGKLLRDPGASLDEFFFADEELTIALESGDYSYLALRTELPDEIEGIDDPGHDECCHGECDDDGDDEYTVHIPPGFGISRGETSSMGAILREIGSDLSISAIDGFILDQFFHREYGFEELYGRIFPEEPGFVDEAQETIFRNELEERFERFSERYDRAGDEIKGPLRERVMLLIEERMDAVGALKSRGGCVEALPEKVRNLLKDAADSFDRILDLLNSPACIPDSGDGEAIAENIESAAEIAAAALERL